jgi:hypothetical protein
MQMLSTNGNLSNVDFCTLISSYVPIPITRPQVIAEYEIKQSLISSDQSDSPKRVGFGSITGQKSGPTEHAERRKNLNGKT